MAVNPHESDDDRRGVRVFPVAKLPRLLRAIEDPTGDGAHRLADDGPVSWAAMFDDEETR